MSTYRVLTHLTMPEGLVHPGAVVELDDQRGATLTKMHVVEPYVAEAPVIEDLAKYKAEQEATWNDGTIKATPPAVAPVKPTQPKRKRVRAAKGKE